MSRYFVGTFGGALIGLFATHLTREKPVIKDQKKTSLIIGQAIATEPECADALKYLFEYDTGETNKIAIQRLIHAINKLASFWLGLEMTLSEAMFESYDKNGGAVNANKAYEAIIKALTSWYDVKKIDTTNRGFPIPIPSSPLLQLHVIAILRACENWQNNAIVAFEERKIDYARMRTGRITSK
jgi:hypothetical protein